MCGHQIGEKRSEFGRYANFWVAASSNPSVSFKGSSGGVIRSIAAHMLEVRLVEAVLSMWPDPGSPTRYSPRFITDPDDCYEMPSSIYAPTSILSEWSKAKKFHKVAVIGRPCDISTLRQNMAPNEVENVVFISFFCGGMPSWVSSISLAKRFALEEQDISHIAYRGNGCPGGVFFQNDPETFGTIPYKEAWGGNLNKSLHSRCKICIDSVGENADIVASDIWDVDARGFPVVDKSGDRNGIIARTNLGLKIVSDMVACQKLNVEQGADISDLEKCQTSQVHRRTYGGARIFAFTLLGLSPTRFRGFERRAGNIKKWIGNFYGAFRRGLR